jgi:aminoglycoside phosphotransferase (APT) family kinase protein
MIVDRAGQPAAILRLAPGDPNLLPGLSTTDEGLVLETLGRHGVPVPEVLINDETGETLGSSGLLLRYVEGTCVATWDELRERWGDAPEADALAVLAAFHRVQASFPPVGRHAPGEAGDHARFLLGRAIATGALDASTIGRLEQLATEPPPPSTAGWAHGDFRPANFVVAGGRIAAVLDWEMSAWGDPARDLGIATMAQWGRWWGDADLLDRYEAATSRIIEPRRLLWWRCLGYGMVVVFLAERFRAGWSGAPEFGPYVASLEAGVADWQQS